MDVGSGTVARVVRVISFFADKPEVTIKSLSAGLGMAPSTCHRLLDLLSQEGIISHDAVRRAYRPGPELFRIAGQVHAGNDVRVQALRFMRRIVEVFDETCVLARYNPATRHMAYSEVVESSRLLRYRLDLHLPLPLLWGATGRAIAAFLPVDQLRELYAIAPKSPGSGRSLPKFLKLMADFEEIRTRGYAVSRGEQIAGAVGVSAAVFDALGDPVASIGVTIPESRIENLQLAEAGAFIASVAAELSAALGARMASD